MLPYIWLFGPKQPGLLTVRGPRYAALRWHALHYASAVFEGIRIYQTVQGGRAIFRLRDHLARFLRSAELLRVRPIGLTLEQLERACVEVARRDPTATYLRPIAFRGEGLRVNPNDSPVRAAILAETWGAYLTTGRHNDGVRVMLSTRPLINPRSLPSEAKSSARYAANQLAKAEALEQGYGEALMPSWEDDGIGEGTGMNFMLVMRDGEIVTPHVQAGILPGLTRATIMTIVPAVLGNHWQVTERHVDFYELRRAQQAFFTGTAVEVDPVTWIQDAPIGDGFAGNETLALRAAYLDIVQGANLQYAHWLTEVPAPAPTAGQPNQPVSS